jgi:pentatricopeptide repeat protein
VDSHQSSISGQLSLLEAGGWRRATVLDYIFDNSAMLCRSEKLIWIRRTSAVVSFFRTTSGGTLPTNTHQTQCGDLVRFISSIGRSYPWGSCLGKPRLFSNGGRSQSGADRKDQSRGAGLAEQYKSKIKKARSWEESIALFNEMQGKGIETDAYHFSTAINGYGKARQWKQALQLLREMEKRGIKPTLFTYNAAISACGKCGQWEKALELHREMDSRGIKSNVTIYNTAINAYGKGG